MRINSVFYNLNIPFYNNYFGFNNIKNQNVINPIPNYTFTCEYKRLTPDELKKRYEEDYKRYTYPDSFLNPNYPKLPKSGLTPERIESFFNDTGIKYKINPKNKLYIISEYNTTYPDLFNGITNHQIIENELFEHIEKVEGNFYIDGNSYLNNLGALEIIGGNCDIADSRLYNLGNLKIIEGNADFMDYSFSLGKLEKIGGSALFDGTRLPDTGNLKYIGGDAVFNYAKINGLDKLEYIGGCAEFIECVIKNTGKSEYIDENTKSENDVLNSLKYIGSDADFTYSSINAVNNLKYIGGDVHLSHDIKFKNLEHADHFIYYKKNNKKILSEPKDDIIINVINGSDILGKTRIDFSLPI